MKFLVEWRELIFDVFNQLKETKNKPLLEIEASSLELGRERAEAKINRNIIMSMREQTGQQKGNMIIGEVVALVDENGIRYQFSEK